MNKPFRNRLDTIRLTSDQARRQGQATRIVLDAFPAPAVAIAFLNTHNAALGGRPIDLAVESDTGLRAIEDAIAANSDGMWERADDRIGNVPA